MKIRIYFFSFFLTFGSLLLFCACSTLMQDKQEVKKIVDDAIDEAIDSTAPAKLNTCLGGCSYTTNKNCICTPKKAYTKKMRKRAGPRPGECPDGGGYS